MKRLLMFVASLPLAALAVTTPPAAADPVSCTASYCVVSVGEYAPPVSVGATAIAWPAGTSYVGSSAWLADVVTAFQDGRAYVTPADTSATTSQVVSAPGDQWLIFGQQVGYKPDGSKVFVGVYKPANWANHDSTEVLITTAPGSVSVTGSVLHWDVTNYAPTTYAVTVAPDRKSIKLKTTLMSAVLPAYYQAGIDVESTPDGTTFQTTPQVLP